MGTALDVYKIAVNMKFFIWFALFLSVSKYAFGVNILYVDQVASPSHHIWNRVLALGLAKRGHNVTILSHHEEDTPPPNYHTILMEDVYPKIAGEIEMDSISHYSAFEGMKFIYDWSYTVCKVDFDTQGLNSLLSYPRDHFDLIVYDVTLGYCLYPLIDRFNKPPVVAVTVFLLPPVLSNVFGNPLQTAYFPYFSTTYSDKMTFMERVWNSAYIYSEVFYRKYFALPQEEELARGYFGDNYRSFEEIERSIGLLISNTDPVLNYPLDLPPNIIPVGGLQIAPAKPLPNDLRKIMDEAKHGVVLFTLGSNLRSDQLSVAKRNVLIEAFKKLPQIILWKFETENVADFPKNVIIRKWLPQKDILGHKNTKLFITHGGGLGTQEAMYYGIPIVAIPFLADQIANAGKLVRREMGKMLRYRNLENEDVYGIITEVISNPKYTNNIKKLSERYRDQLATPLDRALFWIEYLIRHGTVDHLTLAARDMPFYQIYNFDIIIFLLFLVIALYSLIMLVFTCLKFAGGKVSSKGPK